MTEDIDLDQVERQARAANGGRGDQYLLYLLARARSCDAEDRNPLLARIAAVVQRMDPVDAAPIRMPAISITASDSPSIPDSDTEDP